MKHSILIASILFPISLPCGAADAPQPPETSSRWTGPYAGVNAGYSWNDSAADFTLLPEANGAFGLPAQTKLNSKGFTGGAQAGYNYRIGRIVFGPEVDFSELGQSASSTATGQDGFSFPYVTTKSQHLDWLGTGRFRLGVTPTDRLLLYGTGGVAFGHASESAQTTASGINLFGTPLFGLNNGGSISGTRVGPTIGAGAEYTLSDRISAKLEYLYYDLGDAVVAGPPQSLEIFSPNRSNTRFDLNGQILRVGLNYAFDPLPSHSAAGDSGPFAATFLKDFQLDFGTRYWVSDGKTVKHLFSPSHTYMNSELSYEGLEANPLELFARVDHSSGLFLKGNIGTGAMTDGKLKDEDFPPLSTPYSSTTSEQKDGSITYGTIDAGYDFLRRDDYRLGAFVGYNYYHEVANADGCVQMAGGADCIPAISDAIRGITNDGQWNSARIGVNGQVMPTDRLKLSGDVAWLPYTSLSSQDLHWLRINAPGGFTGPVPDDGTGHNGYQLETVVSYQITPAFSLGLGGRYWYMETSGYSHFEGNVTGGHGVPQPVNLSTNRYGAFMQASYKF